MRLAHARVTHLRGESKKFVDSVNKIKSTYVISLKLPNVCDQFNTNKHRKVQTNRLINVVSMAICLMRVSATRSTPELKTLTSFANGFSVYAGRVKSPYKNIISHSTSSKFSYIYSPSMKDYSRRFKANRKKNLVFMTISATDARIIRGMP